MEAVGVNQSFWSGRRVFVTGHTGFKGAWLLVMLRALGARVTGFALPPPTTPSLFSLLDLAGSCDHHVGDIRDAGTLETALQQAQPEVVLHLAAQPLVQASYTIPVETYAVNVMGTVNLMDACRRIEGLRAAVMITTDKCYENVSWTWGYRENDRLGGFDPYSNSKACCELAIDAYRSSYFPPTRHGDHRVGLASARAGNVIGGGDFAEDRLIPDAIRAFEAGLPLQIRNPLSVRPWQHVLEPLYGYLMLAERLFSDPDAAAGWNFGPATDESAPVRLVVDRLAELWGRSAVWHQDPIEHPHEAATLKLDCTKARVELGWSPRFTLDEALQKSAAWYLNHADGGDVPAFTERQVADYLSLGQST